MHEFKTVFCSAVGLIGGAVAAAFGGWNAAMMTLIALMAVDYLTGLMVAGIFHKSPKSESGALESKAGWKGLCRKGVTLLVVLVAAQLARAIGTGFIRDAAVIGYIANETLSIIENAGLMGVPVPNAVKKGIELLKKKEDEDA